MDLATGGISSQCFTVCSLSSWIKLLEAIIALKQKFIMDLATKNCVGSIVFNKEYRDESSVTNISPCRSCIGWNSLLLHKRKGVKMNSLLHSIDVAFFKKNLICVVERNEQFEVCITIAK